MTVSLIQSGLRKGAAAFFTLMGIREVFDSPFKWVISFLLVGGGDWLILLCTSGCVIGIVSHYGCKITDEFLMNFVHIFKVSQVL